MKDRLVTLKQAEELKNLGFNEETQYYHMSGFGICKSYSDKWNEKTIPFPFSNKTNITKNPYTSVPFVDDVLNWFLKKYNILFDIKIRKYSCEITIKVYTNFYILNKIIITKNHYTAKRKVISRLIKYVKKTKPITPKTKERKTSR